MTLLLLFVFLNSFLISTLIFVALSAPLSASSKMAKVINVALWVSPRRPVFMQILCSSLSLIRRRKSKQSPLFP